MSKSSTPEPTGLQLIYFAAERTLMAWIRTSLALMALGFVIDRFGLILRQALPEAAPGFFPKAFSLWSGVGMVGLGAAMALVATVRYLRFQIEYNREGTTRTRRGILMGVIFSFIASVLGVVLAVFMLLAME